MKILPKHSDTIYMQSLNDSDDSDSESEFISSLKNKNLGFEFESFHSGNATKNRQFVQKLQTDLWKNENTLLTIMRWTLVLSIKLLYNTKPSEDDKKAIVNVLMGKFK